MKHIFLFVSLLFSFIFPLSAWAATCTGSSTPFNCTCTGSGDEVAIQAKIDTVGTNQAATVNIAAGDCSFSNPLTWTNKSITINGAGIASTTITQNGASVFRINNRNDGVWASTLSTTVTSGGTTVYLSPWVVKNLTIVLAPYNSHAFSINEDRYGAVPFAGWRITNVKFSALVNPNGTLGMHIYGLNWGLIDNSQFINTGSGGWIAIKTGSAVDDEYNGVQFQSYMGNASWALPLNLGTEEALYIEDSVFNASLGSATDQAVIDTETGSAVVFRHNVVTQALFYTHTGEGGGSGGLGRGGIRKFEIYNNNFIGNGVAYPIVFQENGTGVIFNNKTSGYTSSEIVNMQLYRMAGPGTGMDFSGRFYGNCWGLGTNCGGGSLDCQNWKLWIAPQSYDGNLETAGWPCLDQYGRSSGSALGTAQASVPVYLWRNGTQDECYTNSGTPTCTGTAGVSLTQGYTPQWAVTNYMRGYDAILSINTTHTYNGDRDYCVGTTAVPLPDSGGTKCGNHTYSYTSYTYPHPLRGEGLRPPSGVRIITPVTPMIPHR